MRIGEVSRQSKLSIATIRYYISAGLIVPSKKNTKFYFTQNDLETIRQITLLKDMGFSITDIHRIISLRRLSNWVEPPDMVEYTGLLLEQKRALENQRTGIENQIRCVDRELRQLEDMRLVEGNPSGVPTKALELLTCPLCKLPLQLKNAQMDYRYIMNCDLLCACGYAAEVRNGIIYTRGGRISPFDKPDSGRSMYRDLPSELVTCVQKTYNWMFPLLTGHTHGKIIMETHINSFFFLYKHFHELNRENLYILSDKFAEIVEMYKTYIERLGMDLNIIYIVSSDNSFPIREGVVDYYIDYCSSNYHELFFSSFLLHEIFPYLRDSGQVVTTYFSLDPAAPSMGRLQERYPESAGCGRLLHYKACVQKFYHICKHERIARVGWSGKGIAFVFHQGRYSLSIDCFHMTKKPV